MSKNENNYKEKQMSKSPLSGAFAGSSATTKKKNKKNGAILLISGIALATSIGGVFAANSITINSGSSIEFGQGVAATSTCDTDGITTSVTQEFVTGTTFRVNDVVVASIDNTGCADKGLRVALLDSSNAELTSTLFRGNVTSKTWDINATTTVTADVVRKVVVTSQNTY
jgi:hypothetical protein